MPALNRGNVTSGIGSISQPIIDVAQSMPESSPLIMPITPLIMFSTIVGKILNTFLKI